MSQDKFLFFLITVISIAIITSFSMSPIFTIQDIEFEGMILSNEDEIAKKLYEFENTNIFLIDQRKIKSILLKNSLIKEVNVQKKYPDSLLITVKEREPLAKIINHGEYLRFTADGFIFNKELDVSIPEVQGLAYNLNLQHISFSPLFEEIVQALEHLNTDIRAVIDLIRYEEKENELLLYKREVSIYLGNINRLEEKFRTLESILFKSKEEGLDIKYIDIRLFNKPVIKLK
ncbi:cell division protein FtsQ/DivIB [Natronospora cellulosivora (SeqCode)]